MRKFSSNFRGRLSLLYFAAVIISSLPVTAQQTNSHASGKIISDKKEAIPGATITAVHEPTKNIFIAQSHSDGNFHLSNLRPGGPYTLTVSHTGYGTTRKEDIYFNLANSELFATDDDLFNIILNPKHITLAEVALSGNLRINNSGIETNISNHQIQAAPSISRNLQDYIRFVPQAKVNADGAISLAGQSSRFNAFFIDGANNKDIQGLSQSGTNGGVTGSAPISMDAIEEIKVLLAPYDVQYSNFTGGSINAITRSGTNEIKASAWYYFRNEKLAGRSPVHVEKQGSPGIFERPRLTHFLNQTAGTWVSGPVIKNKLFYFFLAEKQSDLRPQPYNISVYQGNSNIQQLNALAEKLKNDYQYDPGSFLETIDKLNVTRLMFKADWNPSVKNKFTITYRYNKADRSAAATSGSTVIAFGNSNFFLPTNTHSATFEWKSFYTSDVSNRLLFTVTDELDDRTWKSKPFPRVTINDGRGSIRFGSGPNTMLNYFKATEFTVSDIIKFIKRQHTFTTGVDFNVSRINDVSIQNYFGSYQFRNLNDFMIGAVPFRLQRSFSLLDEPKGDNTLAAARHKTLLLGIFLNDEININAKLKLNIGVRLDCNSLLTPPYSDKYFNDTAIKTIEQVYNLHGAKAGEVMKPDLQLAPRIGFTYRIPEKKIVISGGGGIFTGHILNIWSSLLHLNNGVSIGGIDINPQQYGLKFNPDPYKQPTPQSLGINPANAKGELDLIAKNFKYPAVFRSSVSIAKKIKGAWTFTGEGIFTKNIYETNYTNVNLVPSGQTTSTPGKRNVYSVSGAPGKIVLPYTQIFLLSNNQRSKGSSFNLSFTIEKQFKPDFYLITGYGFGKSKVLFEPSAANVSYNLQWAQTETVNGKNLAGISVSDADLGHRIFAGIYKKVAYAKNKFASSINLFYNGQSGLPYSYVYGGSMINDNGSQENFDLVYIPTAEDLKQMVFITNQAGETPQQQKDQLNYYIEHDKYLRKHRGEFAARNGARLPFTHIIDLRIQQDFIVKINKKATSFSILFDVFNFTNMLNKNWGRIYFLTDDKYNLIQFAGYADPLTLTPQYQFTPPNGSSYVVQGSTLPGNSARWISQLGLKINFN